MDESALSYQNIRDNYQKVLERIHQAARSAGRDPTDIRLVVVTKTQPVEVIQAVIDAGASELGENYVEEAIPKIQQLNNIKGINWHMIGHVQSRKALLVCQYFQYLHSLDNLKLAERLSRFALELGISLPVWMEFNVSGEMSKSGWNIWIQQNWENVIIDIEKIIALPNLINLGVMTIPPFSDDPEASRPYYQRLRKFQEYVIDRLQLNKFTEVSMGMSADFEVAIQEGSTCVRIGQAILGRRSS